MLRLFLLSSILSGLALGNQTTPPPPPPTNAPSGPIINNTAPITDGHFYLYRLQANWYEANELCRSVVGQLVTFNTQAEYEPLKRFLEINDNNCTTSYWTAGNDLGMLDNYVWMSTGLKLQYFNWYRGQPTHDVKDCETQHCIDLQGVNHFYMSNNYCSQPKYFICEFMYMKR